MAKGHRVRTVNPKKTKKKKAAKSGGKKKAPVAKRRRRRRSSSSSRAHNPRRRRRRSHRAHNPRRRRRANNPGGGGGFFGRVRSGMVVDLAHPFRGGAAIFRLLGKMAGAFMVRKWGDPEAAAASTATMGGRWTIKNHLLNLLGGWALGEVVGRVMSRERGQLCYDGAVDLSASKALWHELIQAIPGGATYFGRRPMGQIPQQFIDQAQAGDIIDDGAGNRLLVQAAADGSKRLVPMMGLQSARALDGLQEARPLDGLQDARALDGLSGYQQRLLQQRVRAGAGMGHYGVMSDDEMRDDAAYTRRGTDDPYLAAYLG